MGQKRTWVVLAGLSLLFLTGFGSLLHQPKSNFFFKLRVQCTQFYWQRLPYPEADLLAGIVLGSKEAIGGELKKKMQKTGTLHIAVASGYNLTVTGGKPVDFLAWWVGRKAAIVVGLWLIWFYTGLVGGEPPVVRAAVILTAVLLAQFLGKYISSWGAFWLAALVMLAWQPGWLRSISFQLSLAAFAGILLKEKIAPWARRVAGVGKELGETVAVQVMVAPIIAYHFGRISLLAPVANILILPLVPILMGWGLLALLLSWLPALPNLILFALYPFLHWIVWVVENLARLPFASIRFYLPWWGVVAYYCFLFFLIFSPTPQSSPKD